MAQWQWVRGVPEVPGGYMIGRYLDNAFQTGCLQQQTRTGIFWSTIIG